MSKATFTVIDRDNSAISRGITEFLQQDGIEVKVPDEEFAMQDAIAKGITDYMLIIPAGYGEEFARSVQDEKPQPKLDAVYSYSSIVGNFVDQYVNEYVGLARTLLIAKPDMSMEAVAKDALRFADERAGVSVLPVKQNGGDADPLILYMTWCSFTLFAGIFTCIAVVVTALSRTELRRRTSVSPLTNASNIAQMSLACALIALAGWAWTFAIGVVFFPNAAAAMGSTGLALSALAMLAFCLIPLALGIFLGRLGITLLACNAVAVLVGQLISFFSGAWVPFDILSSEVQTMAHWLPGYWYANACNLAADIGAGVGASGAAGGVGAAIQPYLQDFGILLLFAIAIFSLTFIKRKNV